MTFDYVSQITPDSAEQQETLALNDVGAKIPYTHQESGTDMIFSVWCKSDTNGQFQIQHGNFVEILNSTTNWSRVNIDFKSPEDILILVGSSITLYLYEAQIQSGNKLTDWNPAPEDDVENFIQAQNGIETAQETANNALDIAQTNSDNLAKWFRFDSTEGLVIQAVDVDTKQPITDWKTVTDENGYRIIHASNGALFEAYKDRTRVTKLEFKNNNRSMIMKSDGRGGVVFVRGD